MGAFAAQPFYSRAKPHYSKNHPNTAIVFRNHHCVGETATERLFLWYKNIKD